MFFERPFERAALLASLALSVLLAAVMLVVAGVVPVSPGLVLLVLLSVLTVFAWCIG
ncbi:MAG TPA: hypothetical protein VK064_08530 [Wenzhouxiangella sp.]|nr:hypothetical protein [Wenzhouxiangella sp.]